MNVVNMVYLWHNCTESFPITHLEREVCDQETSLGLGIHSFHLWSIRTERRSVPLSCVIICQQQLVALWIENRHVRIQLHSFLKGSSSICLHHSPPPYIKSYALDYSPPPSIDAYVIHEYMNGPYKSTEETFQIRNIVFFVLHTFTGSISGGFSSKQFI